MTQIFGMLTLRPRIRRSPKTYWLFENALQSGNFWKLHWSNIERKKSIIVITIPVLKQKRHYLWMGETIRKRLVCTRIFLKTEKIYMLFQTTRIRVDMSSHGTCCELYFSAKQRDLKQKLQRTLTTKSCTNFAFWCMTTIPLFRRPVFMTLYN